MAKIDRGALITKAFKVLRKHYEPFTHAERPVLEQMLYGLCLENADVEAATKAFETLKGGFFDWNEVRVSTVEELGEAMSMLPEPKAVAHRVKRFLYSVFETGYSFDLESIKKMNVGAAIQKLEKHQGASPFAIAVVTQSCLGGHAIPLDKGALLAFSVLGLATDADISRSAVPGLERAIPKNKGIEFGTVLHRFAAELIASPYSTNMHKILLEISPEAKENLPKRPPKAPPKPEVPAKPAKGQQPLAKGALPQKGTGKAPAGKPSEVKETRPAAKADQKSRAPEKGSDKKPAPARPVAKEEAPKRHADKKHEKVSPKKKPNESLTKRKPR